MKKISHTKSLGKSGILRSLKAEPGPGKDLLILPDIPAVRQARKMFVSVGNSAPFITTFGILAQKHNVCRPERRQILSRTGRVILMRKALEARFPEQIANRHASAAEKTKLVSGLLRMSADLKQNGMTASSVIELSKGKLPSETFEKLTDIEPVLTEFERQTDANAMTDDTGAITELAKAIERGNANGVNGKVRRIIAAGFHRLAPSHLKVMEAAEKAGMPALLLKAEPAKRGENAEVFLSSFPVFSNEAEFAASKIREMIDGGRKIEDFAVIVRAMHSVAETVENAFERNGVPVALESGAGLGAASAVSVLLGDFLAASQAGQCGKEFMRLLENPMLETFFPDNIFEAVRAMESAMEKTGMRNQTNGGLFEQITEPLRAEQRFEKTLEKITELWEILSAHLPADGGPVKMSGVFSGLALLVDKTGAGKSGIAQDRSLEEAREFLREAAFLSRKWNIKAGSAAEVSVLAGELLSGRSYARKTRADGPCVPVMNALQARGTSYPVVFVLDFSENSFPRRAPARMVFSEEERNLVNRCCGAEALATGAAHLNDEKLIWQSVSVCADEELHILFSRNGTGTDGRGNCSHFIEDLGEGSGIPEEKKRDSTFQISEKLVYSPEIARAAAFASVGEIPDNLKKILLENDPLSHLADRVGPGFAAENERLRAEGNFCGFEGIVKNPEDRWWKKLRVSDIEKMGTCPFMFFCSKALGIKESSEIGEIPGAADTGSLYHAALKHFFSQEGGAKAREKSGEETERALSEFLGAKETKKLHCRVSDEVWELQKERALHMVGRFVEFEQKRIREGNFTPELFERDVRFEIGGAEISGRLDRMDKTPAGGARVVDYKKGSVETRSFCDRENLQVPLYLAQISGELKIAPEGGAYLSVERPWERNEKTADGKNGVFIEAAKDFLKSSLNLVKKGFFAPVPVKKPDGFPYEGGTVLKKTDRPCGFCGYSDICRIKDGTLRTAERE